jgi:hypothetical protein
MSQTKQIPAPKSNEDVVEDSLDEIQKAIQSREWQTALKPLNTISVKLECIQTGKGIASEHTSKWCPLSLKEYVNQLIHFLTTNITLEGKIRQSTRFSNQKEVHLARTEGYLKQIEIIRKEELLPLFIRFLLNWYQVRSPQASFKLLHSIKKGGIKDANAVTIYAEKL